MTSITFMSATNEATLRGAERAHLGMLCEYTATGLIVGHLGTERAAALLGVHERGNPWGASLDTIRLGMSSFMDRRFLYDGEPVDPWTFGLNTVLAAGNDVLRLAARVNAQCEIHGWIEATDCAWVAGIVREGLETGVFRKGMGWDAVVALLEESHTVSPVVMQYSVTDSFVNRYHANMGEDAFDALDNAAQWAVCQPYLAECPQLQPRGWATYRFTHCLSVFDVDPERVPIPERRGA